MTEEAQPRPAGDEPARDTPEPPEDFSVPEPPARAAEAASDPDPVDPVPPAPVPTAATPSATAAPAGSYPPPSSPAAPVAAAPYPVGDFHPGPPPFPGGHPGAAAVVRGPVALPPRDAVRPPRRVDAVPGTPFGVVYLDVPPVTSGPAVGSLVAGIGSVLVSLLVACFGLGGADGGWGAWAAGAFAVLGGLLGMAAVALALVGMRQIRRPASPPTIRFTGRGFAIAGLICGGVGLTGTVLAFALALFLQVR